MMGKNYALFMECKPRGLAAAVDLTAGEAMDTMEQWSTGGREWKRIYIVNMENWETVSELTEEMMEAK